jgi:hypothetical protein
MPFQFSFTLWSRILSISSCIYWSFVLLLWIVCSIHSFSHFFTDLLIHHGVNFFSSLYILVINPLSDVHLGEIFSHSVDCLFSQLTVFFAVQGFFSLLVWWHPICQLFLLIAELLEFIHKVLTICSSISPIPSCSSFRVSYFMLRCLIHFEFILLEGEGLESSFNLLQVDI